MDSREILAENRRKAHEELLTLINTRYTEGKKEEERLPNTPESKAIRNKYLTLEQMRDIMIDKVQDIATQQDRFDEYVLKLCAEIKTNSPGLKSVSEQEGIRRVTCALEELYFSEDPDPTIRFGRFELFRLTDLNYRTERYDIYSVKIGLATPQVDFRDIDDRERKREFLTQQLEYRLNLWHNALVRSENSVQTPEQSFATYTQEMQKLDAENIAIQLNPTDIGEKVIKDIIKNEISVNPLYQFRQSVREQEGHSILLRLIISDNVPYVKFKKYNR